MDKKVGLRFLKSLLVCCVFVLFLTETNRAQADLDESDFETLHEALKPDSSKLWRQIPWRVSLLEGQRNAVAEGKPIFIWAMDGHPLGCT